MKIVLAILFGALLAAGCGDECGTKAEPAAISNPTPFEKAVLNMMDSVINKKNHVHTIQYDDMVYFFNK